MVEFSNIFILFTLLQNWLHSMGVDIGGQHYALMYGCLAVAVLFACIGLIKKNKSDANRYNII